MSNEKINILHLQPELNKTCGVSKTIYYITKYHNDGFEHFILTFGGDNFKRFKDEKIYVRLLKSYKSELFSLCVNTLEVIRFCRKYKINIIHAHHRYFDFIAFFISKFIKIKTITSVDSLVNSWKILSYKSKILIACSNAVKNHLENYFGVEETKIYVINNFINVSEIVLSFNPTSLKKELGIPEGKVIIGYICRLDIREKGIDILIKSLVEIRKVKSNIFLLLVGGGKDEGIIRKNLIRSNLDYLILGPQENIFDYYNLIDVFVLPSNIESFGIVVLEAGLMKKPVVGSNTGGIRETIKDNNEGFLFEQGNHIDLIDKIFKILNDFEYALVMGQNLNKKVLDRYTSEKGISKYEKVYKELLLDKYG